MQNVNYHVRQFFFAMALAYELCYKTYIFFLQKEINSRLYSLWNKGNAKDIYAWYQNHGGRIIAWLQEEY